jgi:UDP-N-acetylmuramate dehydrogenase
LAEVLTSRLVSHFGERLMQNASLGRYTSARVGGNADGLIEVRSAKDLADTMRFLWSENIPCRVLGGGSNLLISDDGYHGIAVINKSSDYRIEDSGSEVTVFAESGVNLGKLARKVSLDGWTGLEWAAGIPGTVGGAIFGNAGAHGSDMAGNLEEVEILFPDGGLHDWSAVEMDYSYRSSRLKREKSQAVILSAGLFIHRANPDEINARLDEYLTKRKDSQPTGASLGSMFKNPKGDFAGRLIEAAGLKGTRIGGAEISPKHGNFFLNDENATAQDIYDLLRRVQKTVSEKFNVELEPEIELLGSFKDGI